VPGDGVVEALERLGIEVERRGRGLLEVAGMAGSSQGVAVRCGVAIRRDIGLRE
jgi:hypothetical protein